MPHGDDLSVAITHGGTIRLRAAALGPAADAQRSRFLCRALACRDVEAIDVDTAAGEAVLQLADPAATGRDTAASLMELAEAIRGKRTALDPASLPADCLRRGRVSVRRYAGRLSTWLVEPSRPGLIRLAHAELRRDRALARGVERVLVTMPGVRQVSIGRWRGEIVVRHDPGGFDADAMLAILQHMVDARSSMPVVSTRGTMVRSSATLGLAAVTDLVIPGLAPLTSLVLVANNLRTVSRAAGDTLARRVGMPTVMTAILVGTLATGQFLAAGIMAWSYDFWRRRHRRDIEAERRLLLEDAAPLPECSSLLDDGGGLQVAPVAVSRRGSRLEVVAPQMVPLDGRVIGGEAIVDARLPTGCFGVRHASPGDTVFAGTILLEGSLLVEADRDADASRIVGIARAIGAATRVLPGRQAPTVTAERFAEEFAGPTLATAALGLFAGDVNTAVAVMRPDYANAEAVSVSLSDLDAISSAIERGCLLKSAGMLDRLASVDCLLVIGCKLGEIPLGRQPGEASRRRPGHGSGPGGPATRSAAGRSHTPKLRRGREACDHRQPAGPAAPAPGAARLLTGPARRSAARDRGASRRPAGLCRGTAAAGVGGLRRPRRGRGAGRPRVAGDHCAFLARGRRARRAGRGLARFRR